MPLPIDDEGLGLDGPGPQTLAKVSTLMRKEFFLAAAMALSAALIPVNAQAFTPAPTAEGFLASDIVPIAEGCGPGYHRGPYGHCRPNGPGWGGAGVYVAPAGPVVVPVPGVVVAPGPGPRCPWRQTPEGPRRICRW
jgi:hypothetical protein